MAAANSASLVKASVVAESFLPSFSGLRVSSQVSLPSAGHASQCSCCRRSLSVRANSQYVSQGAFAAISAAAPPPFVPALLGAGVVAGSALAFLSKPGAPSASSPLLAESQNGAASYLTKRAADAAIATMASTFPNAMQEENFMRALAAELYNLGFRKDNCIGIVNTCRDEVCRPLVNLIDREFGLSFNVAGLGGLVNCGKVGFKAAMSHSPEFPCNVDGTPRERYIFFGFPHVSIGESGDVGSLLRRGRGKPSSACGALIAIRNDISKGNTGSSDPDDPEYCLLRSKVASRLSKSTSEPSLVQVTKAALQAITDDIENLVSLTVDPGTADYAVITGVQIHSGNQIPGEPFRIERTCDYIAPNAMYAVIRGQKQILHCEVNQITSIKSVPADKIAA
jgi:hypothetical protein